MFFYFFDMLVYFRNYVILKVYVYVILNVQNLMLEVYGIDEEFVIIEFFCNEMKYRSWQLFIY